MVAMLAFGGTYAYFTASATDKTGSITTGHVKLSVDGEGSTFTGIANNVLPGDELFSDDATLTVTTTDTTGNYVAIRFTITAASGLTLSADSIVADSGNGWYPSGTENIYIYGSNETTCVPVTTTVEVPLSTLILPVTVEDNWDQGNPTQSDKQLMSATITITMEARSIQASNLTDTDAVAQLVGLFD